jgi:putative transposase
MSWPSAYLKMRILGAIDYADGATIKERIQKVSEITFTDEDGLQRKFTFRTISTWFYRYKSRGITGVNKSVRADKGIPRKMTPEELLEAINHILPFFKLKHHYNKSDIYRLCIEKGLIRRQELSPTNFYRFIRTYELLKDNIEHNKKRLAFSMQYANQLWQADTMFGPFVKDQKGNSIQTKLIAFLDDASRVICHGEFFFNENTDALVSAIKCAFYKRGIPEQLYVDNGSIYTSSEITLICARVGCILRHAPVRDGAAKGKVERFFRTVRDQFLIKNLDLSSLDTLNTQFTLWVEEQYNSSVHSAIGIKPIDRYAFDIKRIKFLSPNDVNDELFYAEVTRYVKKDNTFSFKNIRFEAPADLRDKSIQIRFDRAKPDTHVIIYYKQQRIGKAKQLNLIENGLLRRTKGGAQ